MEKENKINLYIDADDTILLSSETIISLLNEKYNLIPPKTIKDLKDWHYRSIYSLLTVDEVESLYESDSFFDKVVVDPLFIDFYNKYKNNFNFIIVTKGTPLNLSKKQKSFESKIGNEIKFVGMRFIKDVDGKYLWEYNKSSVNMDGGIQIDDRSDSLKSTNASVKILIKRGDFFWNNPLSYQNVENLYVASDWKQIAEILLFFKKNKEFIN